MLVLFSPGFASSESESTCLPAVQQMVLAFKDKLGAENITIISLHYPFTAKSYRWHGIPVYALGGQNKKDLSKILLWSRALLLLFKLQRQHNLKGIVCFWMNEAAFLAKLFSKLKKVPLAFWVQGQDARATNKYVKFIRPTSEQVFSISEFSSQELQRNFGIVGSTIAPNGIRPASFPELNLATRPISIIGVGSLVPVKNYHLFVEVLAELVNTFPTLSVVHCGEGIQAEEIHLHAEKLGVAKYIRFMGNVEHAEVLELMNQSSILFHTSTYEGNSTVTAEALYMGCRVVSTFGVAAENPNELVIATTKETMLLTLTKLLSSPLEPKRVTTHLLADSIDLICEKLSL